MMAHYHPTRRIPTPSMEEAELRALVECYSWHINECYRYLRSIIEKKWEERAIRRKWDEMTLEAQREILDSVWGPLPYENRIDVKMYKGNQNPSPDLLYGRPYACPINSLSLTTNGSFLQFLDSRSRNAPRKFARRDLLDYPFHVLTKQQIPSWADNFCMLLEEDVDEHGGLHYGELIPLDKVSDPWAPWRTDRVYHSFEGIAVLRSQFWTYRFLANCCVIILAYDNDQLTSDSTSPREQTHPSLLQATMEASYKPCSKNIAWERIQLLILAQRDAAVDHFRALRSEPTYYHRTVKEYIGHIRKITHDKLGNLHTEWKRDPPAMGKILAQVCIPAIEEVSM